MAVFFRGLDDGETVALTDAMLHSGDVIDLRASPRPKVDKHSTGGVGDKISLPLAPLVAACGVRGPDGVAGAASATPAARSTSSRRSPASASTSRSRRLRAASSRELGVCMIGQTDRDRPGRQAALRAARRDRRRSSRSRSSSSSILSKKLAEGIDGLVLDVKVGRRRLHEARAEARRSWRAPIQSIGASRRGQGHRRAYRHGRAHRPHGRQRARDARERSRSCAAAGPPTCAS